jgi:hypothetical protein
VKEFTRFLLLRKPDRTLIGKRPILFALLGSKMLLKLTNGLKKTKGFLPVSVICN